MNIHQFLYDWRFLVLVVNLPLLAYFGRRFLVALASPASMSGTGSRHGRSDLVRPLAAAQGRISRASDAPARADKADPFAARTSKPASLLTKPVADAPPAGAAARRDVKPEARTSSGGEDQDIASLFAGLGASEDKDRKPLGPSKPMTNEDAVRNAVRMEQIGFHHHIESDRLAGAIPHAPPAPPAVIPVAIPVLSTTAAPTRSLHEAPVKPAPPSAPATPASRLAELGLANGPTPATAKPLPSDDDLDDILARLDQVLTEDGSAGAATEAKPATEVKTDTARVDKTDKPKAPLWARSDAFDEDVDPATKSGAKQQKLFDEQK